MTKLSDNLLRHKGYSGSVEVSLEDDCLHGRLLHIDDLITYGGSTVAELRAEFEAAVDDYLAYCLETGKVPDKPYTGSFNVRIGHERHRWLVEVAAAANMSLNECVCDVIDAAMLREQPRKFVATRLASEAQQEPVVLLHAADRVRGLQTTTAALEDTFVSATTH